MTMTIYRSTDTSAPTLQGVVGGAYSSGWTDGSLVQLLNKILVSGYGSQPGAGWSLAFHGTSEGVFKQGAGCGFYLHVLDDGSATAGAKEASINGGESYTAVSTGTQLFPTSSQNSGKLFVRKSDTADTTQRPWICFADEKTFYLFTVPQHGSGTEYYTITGFGDFYSFVSGDAYNCMIFGRTTSASTDSLTNENGDVLTSGEFNATAGHYMARGYTQTGSAVNWTAFASGLLGIGSSATQAMGAWTSLAFPNASDGKMYMSRLYVVDNATSPAASVRGFLRGMWLPNHNTNNFANEVTWAGSGSLSGRTFKVLGLRTGNNSSGRATMETSDTWD